MFTIDALPAFDDNYIWVIINRELKTCAIVDPGEAPVVINYLKQHGLTLTAILITHHHGDHVNGVQEVLDYKQVPVYGPSNESIHTVDHKLNDNDIVQLDEIQAEFKAIELPGHTTGQLAYYGIGRVFTGDTLFSAGCGRMFEGTPEQFADSLERLRGLTVNTHVYCGHEYTLNNLKFAQTIEPNNEFISQHIDQCKKLIEESGITLPSTIALEREINPFLRLSEPTVIEAAEKHAGKKLNSPAEVFKVIREWKDNF